MKFEPKSKAYIIEDGWRIIEVQIISADSDFYLVRFPSGGGTQVNSKRLYATNEEAEKVVEGWRSRNNVKIERPVVIPKIKASLFHSPHYFGWI